MSEQTRQAGHYESKQLCSGIPLLSWSHRSRFALARRLVAPYAGQRLLDYGCGDGTFLAMVNDLFPDAIGTGTDVREIETCRNRFAGGSPRFALSAEIAASEYDGAYGVVTCMEVLEHCVGAAVDTVVADLARLVNPSGVVIISVPIEIGPTLIAKQIIRRIAGWRIYDYSFNERYGARDLWRMFTAGERTIIERPVYSSPAGSFHAHKGFNWRALRPRISRALKIERMTFSPLRFMKSFANSQAWFICRRPDPRPRYCPVLQDLGEGPCKTSRSGSR